jgi:resuscitation-promoting factor RpfA
MDKSPDAFRTISEVADLLDTPAHVLRFWESRFPQIRPVKRAGGRRYYRPTDVALLAGIRLLLHDQGLTIRGVQKILREQGVRHVCSLVEIRELVADAQAEWADEDTVELSVVPVAEAPPDAQVIAWPGPRPRDAAEEGDAAADEACVTPPDPAVPQDAEGLAEGVADTPPDAEVPVVAQEVPLVAAADPDPAPPADGGQDDPPLSDLAAAVADPAVDPADAAPPIDPEPQGAPAAEAAVPDAPPATPAEPTADAPPATLAEPPAGAPAGEALEDMPLFRFAGAQAAAPAMVPAAPVADGRQPEVEADPAQAGAMEPADPPERPMSARIRALPPGSLERAAIEPVVQGLRDLRRRLDQALSPSPLN